MKLDLYERHICHVKYKLRASVEEIKKTAFNKLSRCYIEFVCDDKIYCKLCYKSGENVENTPGTNIPFPLDGYKEDLLVLSYAKVILIFQIQNWQMCAIIFQVLCRLGMFFSFQCYIVSW